MHHITPRCLGGSDEKENLVELTAREHFIAHILLVKIYPKEYGLINAVNMMCISNDNQDRSMNRMYGWLREKFSKAQSKRQTGGGNSQSGSMWIYNLELKESKKIPKDSKIPEGWLKGRRYVWYGNCSYCNKEIEVDKIYCNSKCRMYNISPHTKTIDDNIEILIEMFLKNNSIDKTLRSFGITGVRKGNQYFSNIIKTQNIKVLRRRNS